MPRPADWQEPPHGTYARYRLHQNRGEEFCEPCRVANAAWMREYRKRRPEVVATHEAKRVRPADYADTRRSRETLRKYGLTPEAFQVMLEFQGRVCAICRGEFTGRGPMIDHCHETNARRELLCFQCNVGLGNYRDKPALLRAAAEYLERHGRV
jgi:hypothetical protein